MHITLRLALLTIVAIKLGHSAFPQHKCVDPTLLNGFIHTVDCRVFFHCDEAYELIGSEHADCKNGTWNKPVPTCAKSRCTENVPKVENGDVTNDNDHTVTVKCKDGFTLAGIGMAHCNGTHWNPLGTCLDKKSIPLSCDFETENMCGWTNLDLQDLNWVRSSSTNASLLRGWPTQDHTEMQTDSGHFMLIEWDHDFKATMLSPVYPAELSKNACFNFWYSAYSNRTYTLQVYVQPAFKDDYSPVGEELNQISINGEGCSEWKMVPFRVPIRDKDFKIAIRAIEGFSNGGGIAIDDVKLVFDSECSTNNDPTVPAKCTRKETTTTTTTTTTAAPSKKRKSTTPRSTTTTRTTPTTTTKHTGPFQKDPDPFSALTIFLICMPFVIVCISIVYFFYVKSRRQWKFGTRFSYSDMRVRILKDDNEWAVVNESSSEGRLGNGKFNDYS